MLGETFQTKFHVKMKDIQKCSKFRIKSSQCTFHKNKTKNDGLHSDCSVCRKAYYNINQNRVKTYLKKYSEQNREIRISYIKNRKNRC